VTSFDVSPRGACAPSAMLGEPSDDEMAILVTLAIEVTQGSGYDRKLSVPLISRDVPRRWLARVKRVGLVPVASSQLDYLADKRLDDRGVYYYYLKAQRSPDCAVVDFLRTLTSRLGG